MQVAQIFVAFSEKLNFTKYIHHTLKKHQEKKMTKGGRGSKLTNFETTSFMDSPKTYYCLFFATKMAVV